MELTQEHFDKAIKNLATQESLDKLSQAVGDVKQTLDTHTTSLDALAKDVKSLTEEMLVNNTRVKNVEIKVFGK